MLSIYIKYLVYFITGSILITAITLIAEKKSSRIGGILMTLPVITFLSLLFLAFSQGVVFSSRAAVWNPIGSIADLIYMGLFAVGISLPGYIRKKDHGNSRKNNITELFFGLFLGFTGYFIFIILSSNIKITNGWLSLAALWVAAIIFYRIFKIMKEEKRDKIKIASGQDIILRGLFGGSVVLAVVILGDSFGYTWGGLFSSFPGTITPVLVLLHLNNGKEMSYGAIKSSPVGLSSTGLYSCAVWLSYPACGIVAGTFFSYAAVLLFLLLIFYVTGYKNIMK